MFQFLFLLTICAFVLSLSQGDDNVCHFGTFDKDDDRSVCRGGPGSSQAVPSSVIHSSIRSELLHDPRVPLGEPLPRIHVSELRKPGFEKFRYREQPFILTGAMENWPALKKWPVHRRKNKEHAFFRKHFGTEVVDYYPYNMIKPGSNPYLMTMEAALRELHAETDYTADKRYRSRYEPDASRPKGKYLHLQLTPKTWQKLEKTGTLPKKRDTHTKGDLWWMNKCLQENAVREEYHIKTHWKIILIGTRGAGMFNHSDSLLTSSWHGHIEGRKWWYVCTPNYASSQKCWESILLPGEKTLSVINYVVTMVCIMVTNKFRDSPTRRTVIWKIPQFISKTFLPISWFTCE